MTAANTRFRFGGRRGGFAFSAIASSVQSLTNNQKLSLPPATPVGTQVNVTDAMTSTGAGTSAANGSFVPSGDNDGKTAYTKVGSLNRLRWNAGAAKWRFQSNGGTVFYESTDDVATPNLVTTWTRVSGAVGLPTVTAGITQQLNDPSALVTAMFPSGAGTAEANAIYTSRGMNEGKEYYNILGAADNVTVSSIRWDGSQWDIFSASGDSMYFSPDDVTTPDLATTWNNNFFGDPPSPTVAPITQGELDAGTWNDDAGSEDANGARCVVGNATGFNLYQTPGGSTDSQTSNAGDIWRIGIPVGLVGYLGLAPTAFPWETTYEAGDGSDPAPTVQRSNPAGEANWGPVTP